MNELKFAKYALSWVSDGYPKMQQPNIQHMAKLRQHTLYVNLKPNASITVTCAACSIIPQTYVPAPKLFDN